MGANSKEQKFNAVYDAVLVILNSHSGLGGVNHSALSRISGVSRPWIYKYIGKTKEELIQKTSEHFIHGLFSQRQHRSIQSLEDLKEVIREDTLHFLVQAQKYPRVIPLFFIYFESRGPIGNIMREAFQFYSGKLAENIESSLEIPPAEAELLAEMFSLFRLGLAFFLTRVSKIERPFDRDELQKLYGQLRDLL